MTASAPNESNTTPDEPRAGDARLAPGASHAFLDNHRSRHHVLRIRITDVETGRLKVSLTLPPGLVLVALRQGARLVPAGPATTALLAAERGELREPVVVDDVANGERVEIAIDR